MYIDIVALAPILTDHPFTDEADFRAVGALSDWDRALCASIQYEDVLYL
jgi:hypothetical protein